ncbi:hypothetical protein [Rhizobium lusitanum]|uniref:Uncharacterized protein n=1 Tax=Rhizobium lusitanum TaxID=293958 RepID=A0A7X0MB61_9HYPH|nr:hypothetical protein [Rhizobium lusitanum]MBB6484432.1 hypothetical protein [Rhizobium lusitanum]
MYRNVDVLGRDTMGYKVSDASAISRQNQPFAPLSRQVERIVSDCIGAPRSYKGIQKAIASDTSAIHATGFLKLTIQLTGETDV